MQVFRTGTVHGFLFSILISNKISWNLVLLSTVAVRQCDLTWDPKLPSALSETMPYAFPASFLFTLLAHWGPSWRCEGVPCMSAQHPVNLYTVAAKQLQACRPPTTVETARVRDSELYQLAVRMLRSWNQWTHCPSWFSMSISYKNCNLYSHIFQSVLEVPRLQSVEWNSAITI